jgi:hypothetical protein
MRTKGSKKRKDLKETAHEIAFLWRDEIVAFTCYPPLEDMTEGNRVTVLTTGLTLETSLPHAALKS